LVIKLKRDCMEDELTLTNEIVKKQYEELMTNGLPFLQIFPEMIQDNSDSAIYNLNTYKSGIEKSNY